MVPERGDVVGRVAVEESGQVLDLPAARTELELAAAVGADALGFEVVQRLQERLEGDETLGLDVHHPGPAGQGGDVGH